jgi:hypothetical protein
MLSFYLVLRTLSSPEVVLSNLLLSGVRSRCQALPSLRFSSMFSFFLDRTV